MGKGRPKNVVDDVAQEVVVMSIEGSLDIMWMNPDVLGTPRYNLFFARYANFRNGAQQPYEIVGDEALENYLVRLGFTVEDAKHWIDKVHHERNAASIPNVWMPDERLVDYEPPKAAGA
jgi:hypothetical protein